MVSSQLTTRGHSVLGESYRRIGFTIVELLVVAVIIAMLAMLMLAGLSGARHRAKVDKTKSTIRKLNEIILPHYESFTRRRVPADVLGASLTRMEAARKRLIAIRTLALYEMPDSWADVARSGSTPALTTSGTIPEFAFTSPARAYGASYASLGTPTAQHRSAECLYLIVSRGQLEPELMEQFRSDEIGDTDNDGAPEFLDGWGRPISFMRWPTGFVSPYSLIQYDDPLNRHDPFDPFRREPGAFALTPLIYSAGLDGQDGVVQLERWTGTDLAGVFSVTNNAVPPQRPGAPTTATTTARDNITNHDLGPR